jgi:hypothetical protein
MQNTKGNALLFRRSCSKSTALVSPAKGSNPRAEGGKGAHRRPGSPPGNWIANLPCFPGFLKRPLRASTHSREWNAVLIQMPLDAVGTDSQCRRDVNVATNHQCSHIPEVSNAIWPCYQALASEHPPITTPLDARQIDPAGPG